MGLNLTGKGSIWDALGNVANTVGNGIVAGVKDAGDLFNQGVATVTGNDQAYQNAASAISNNNSNLTGGSFTQNLGGLANDVGAPLEQGVNTGAAGIAAASGLAGYGLDSMFGNQTQANDSLNSGISSSNKYLTHGLGNVGGWLTPAQAASRGTGLKGLGKDFIAPAAKAVATTAPYFVGGPAGDAATGLFGHAATDEAGNLLTDAAGNVVKTLSKPAQVASAGAIGGTLQGGQSAVQQYADTGKVNPGAVFKQFATGFGSGVGGDLALTALHSGPSVDDVKASAAKLAGELKNMDEVGGGTNPLYKAPEDVPSTAKASKTVAPLDQSLATNINSSAEDNVHAQNPLAPIQPSTTAEPTGEPTPADLKASQQAADAIDKAPPPIDYTQVQGSGKRLTQAVNDRASTLKSIDQGTTGGIKLSDGQGGVTRTTEHSPFYSKVYDETGRKPTNAAYQAEAERQLRTGTDAESANYQNLTRHAAAEQTLKDYQEANQKSGYNKVRTKAPEGTPRGVPSVVREVLESPEYKAKSAQGDFLQKVRDELPGARAEVKAYDTQAKGTTDINEIRAINDKSTAARLKLRYLEGQERAQSAEYGRLSDVLQSKYPEVALRKPGAPTSQTVSGAPLKPTTEVTADTANADVAPGKVKTAPATTEPYSLEDALGKKLDNKPYTGPNMNEGAFSDEDFKNLMSHNGQYEGEDGASYSPEHDMTLPDKTPAGPAPRNLDGDKAAFDTITNHGTVDDAVKAYRDATGSSEAEAASAVNRVAETGAGMGTYEEVLKRNPKYDSVKEFPIKNVDDAVARQGGYEGVLKLKEDAFNKSEAQLDDHDAQLLHQLRGNNPADIAKQAHDPEKFTDAAAKAKEISDYNHEIRRLNGDNTLYHEQYGAGTHYSNVTPDEQASVGGYRDALHSTPGFSKERIIGNYETAADKYGLSPKNVNEDGSPSFKGDVHQDIQQTLNYTRSRSAYRSLQESHGPDSVTYGAKDFDHPVQLRGAEDVFATREVAKEWNAAHPEARADISNPVLRTGAKAYKAVTSGIVQATAANPLLHGANIETQGFIAAGKLGPRATMDWVSNHFMSAEDKAAAREGRMQNGDYMPSYGKDENGAISRITKGYSDVNKRMMSYLDNSSRDIEYKMLTDNGMTGREAVEHMNKMMGDGKFIGEATQNLGFFVKFAKTMIGATVETVKSPGMLMNAVVAAGTVWAIDKAFQSFDGNKHTHIHVPGELGIVMTAANAAKDTYDKHYGRAIGEGLNRVNPLVKEGAQQLFNKDLFTGKSLGDTGGRAGHFIKTVLPEAQSGSAVNAGKKSVAETALNFAGVYTPHAKGDQAAPSGNANFLNTSGAKQAPGKDPTGIDQQNAYYDTTEKARNALPPDRQAAFDNVTGQKTGTDKLYQAHQASLAANPDVLDAIAQQKQAEAKATGLPLDPLYDPKYSSAQRAEFAHLQSLPYKGDDYNQQASANAPWLKQLQTDRAAYQKTQDYSGLPPSQRVTPPQFSDQVNGELSTASGLSGSEKAQYINAHPDLQTAYDSLSQYTNDKRVSEGNAPFKLFPKADPDTQNLLNTFFGLPKGDGPKGGNASESAWIKANPDAYAKVQNYLANVSEYDLANSAGQDKYQGATPSQQELKSAYSLGKYDIAKDKTTGVYSINPSSVSTASYAGSGGGSGGGGSSKSASYAQNRAASNYRKSVNAQRLPKVMTAGQSRRVLARPFNNRYLKTSSVSTAPMRQPKTGKLRIKSAII